MIAKGSGTNSVTWSVFLEYYKNLIIDLYTGEEISSYKENWKKVFKQLLTNASGYAVI